MSLSQTILGSARAKGEIWRPVQTGQCGHEWHTHTCRRGRLLPVHPLYDHK